MYLIFRQLQFSRISCRVLLLACAVQLSTRVSDFLTVPRCSAAACSLVSPPLVVPLAAGVLARIPTGSPNPVSSAGPSTEYSSTAYQMETGFFLSTLGARAARGRTWLGRRQASRQHQQFNLQVGARAGKVERSNP